MAECNLAFARMYGFADCKDLVGKRLFRFPSGRGYAVDPEQAKRFVAAGYRLEIQEIRETGEDGVSRWFSRTLAGIVEKGRLVGVWGIQRDITAMKKVVRELEQSEKRYRSMVRALPDVLLCIDSGMRFTDVQTSMPELVLRLRREMIGKGIQDVLPPDVAELAARHFREALCTARPQVFRHSLEVGGKTRDLEVRMVPCGEGEVLAIVRDETERRATERKLRASEARYHAVINEQTELVCRTDGNDVLTFVNQAFCRYFGRRGEDILGRSFSAFAPEEDREILRRKYFSLGAANPIVTYEQRMVGIDGRPRWMEWTDRPVFNEDGEVMEYQSVGRDITEQKELRKRLLEISEREREWLAQELHDGLCQDLKGLEIEAALLEDHVAALDEGAGRLAAAVGGQANAAVRKAYEIARGMFAVELDARSLGAALEDLVSRTAAQTQARMKTRIEPNIVLPDDLHARQLYRIAQEALTNAARHAQAGEIELTWQREGGRAVLQVRDDGIGWNHDAAECSSGLGLAVMQSRAQSLGAVLHVRSAPGQGAVVRIGIGNLRVDA